MYEFIAYVNSNDDVWCQYEKKTNFKAPLSYFWNICIATFYVRMRFSASFQALVYTRYSNTYGPDH